MRMLPCQLAAALVCTICTTAPAAFTLNWVPVAITVTTDALTPAPGLAGYTCWDLWVDTDVGDDFQSYRISIPASQGFTFFNHSLSATAPWGPPSAAQISAFPTLQYTMQQAGPHDTSLSVLGGYNGTNELPPPAIFGGSALGIVSGDTVTVTDGIRFRLLRITWRGEGYPTPNGRVSVNVGGHGTQNQNLWYIPEPATLSLLAFGLVLGGRLRSR